MSIPPQPWHVRRLGDGFWINDAHDVVLADLADQPGGPAATEALARLIAAVPELLAKCENWLGEFEDLVKDFYEDNVLSCWESDIAATRNFLNALKGDTTHA